MYFSSFTCKLYFYGAMMDHRKITEQENSPILLTTLEEVDKMLSSNSKESKIDLTKEDVYSDEERIPIDVIESSLKLLRTIRKLAIDSVDYATDVSVGRTIQVINQFSSAYNNGLPTPPLENNNATTTTKPTTTNESFDFSPDFDGPFS